jgi:putative PIN family toxin of toxin-antitoxin system
MQKIVVDTNVLVSALIRRSYPYRIVYELFLEGKVHLCISKQLMQEYRDVLLRLKFAQFQDFFSKADLLLAAIEIRALKFHPNIKLNILSDKDDNMILELADESLADFVITGNTNDFTFPYYRQTKRAHFNLSLHHNWRVRHCERSEAIQMFYFLDCFTAFIMTLFVTPRSRTVVIARSVATKQSRVREKVLDCFVAALLAMTTGRERGVTKSVIIRSRFDFQKHKCNDALCLIIRHL